MCGIGGILRTDGQPIPEAWLDAIDARIAYRGPDGSGRFRDRVEIDDPAAPGGRRVVEVAFVHRRLSIIDHAGGRQPMVSERGRDESEGLVAVVFNGCIYNHRELRKELESKGHRFVSDHSDTEVLIHGWREWGRHLVERLEGMYAFAVWDRTRRIMFLARDLFGEKPLYYRDTEIADDAGVSPITPVVAFASDAGSLMSLPAPDRVCGDWCRLQWLAPYLLLGHGWGYIPGPDNVDVSVTPAGSGTVFYDRLVIHRSDSISMDRFEAVPAGQPLESLLETAVRRRLEADVPLGCFLSGGIDSSLVAAFAAKHAPGIETFCVRMPDPRYDESRHAEQAARHLNLRHHTLDPGVNPAEDLVRLIGLLGQPFGDSSILPTYWVSKAARSFVTVALSGDGGDELFMGYQRYQAAPALVRCWRLLKLLPTDWLGQFHPKSPLNKLARLGDMARDYHRLGVIAMEAIFTSEQVEAFEPGFTGRWKCSMDDHEPFGWLGVFGSGPRASDPSTACGELREFDIDHYLPFDLLTKVDTASMACGLEVRCPFLDRDLARAALSTPIEQLMPRGRRKGLLRQIARKYLPKEIVDRPKMGFAIPIGEWFCDDDLPRKGGGMKTLLLDHLNSAEPFGSIRLNKKAVQRFIDEHMSGKRDHGQRLFTLLTLSIWAKQAGRSAAPDS